MDLLLSLAIKGALLLGGALVSLRFLRTQSAAARHWVLAATLAAVAVLPLLHLVLPPLDPGFMSATVRDRSPRGTAFAASAHPLTSPDVQPMRSAAASVDPPISEAESDAPLRVTDLLMAAWVTGLAASVLVLVAGFARLRWLISHARRVESGPWLDLTAAMATECGVGRRVALLQSTHHALLVTCGWLRPRIVLPAGATLWPEDRIRIVLAHELAHIRRADWLVHLAAEALKAVYWFNPLIWIACRRLREESERACDDAVLARGVEGSEYAWQLLQLVRAFKDQSGTWLPAAAIARRSSLEQRIGAMLDRRQNRQPVTPRVVAAASGLLLLLTLPVAAVQSSHASFSGTLVTPGGDPAVGARIVLSRGVGAPAYETRSDANGAFEFVDVPPATYRLDVWSVDVGNQRMRLEGLALELLGETLTLRNGEQIVRDITLPLSAITISTSVAVTPTGEQIRPRDRGFPPTWQCLGGLMLNSFCGPPSLLEEFERDLHENGRLPRNVQMPRLAQSARPDYPSALVGSGVEGSVTLEGTIGADGFVRGLRAIAWGHPAFVDPSFAAAQQMRWEPARIRGVPSDVPIRLEIDFEVRP
jgi:beta-lactamase regulating signal transducer with metallopeptidase domain